MKSPKAKAFDLVLVLTRPSKEQKSRAFRPLRGRVHFFDERQRNGTKENALCPEHTRRFIDEGIFREGILPSSKNGAHPCAPPSGSADILWCGGIFRVKRRSAKRGPRLEATSGSLCTSTAGSRRVPQRGLAGSGNGVTTFSPDSASRIADCPFFSTSSTRTMLCIGRCSTRVLPNSSRRRSSVGSTTRPSCTSKTSSPTSVKPQIALAVTRRAYSS